MGAIGHKSESQVDEVTAGYLATLVAWFCWESFINKCLSTLRYLTPTGLAEVVFHSWPRWAARRFGVIPSEQSIHLGYIGPRATVYNIGQLNAASLSYECFLLVWTAKPKELSEYRRKEPKYPYLLQNGLILISEVLVWGLAMYFDVNWTLILLLVFVVGLSVFLWLEKFFGALKRMLEHRQKEVDLARYRADHTAWMVDLKKVADCLPEELNAITDMSSCSERQLQTVRILCGIKRGDHTTAKGLNLTPLAPLFTVLDAHMVEIGKEIHAAVVNVLVAKRAVDLAYKPLNALKERYRGLGGSDIGLNRINMIAIQEFRHPTPSTANP